MARPRKSQTQQPGAQLGTQGGGGNNNTVIYREGAIVALGNSIQQMEQETLFQRGMLDNLTQEGTLGQAGGAGGVQAGRTTGEPSGVNMAGELSGPDWLRAMMRQHTDFLTPAQVREIAVQQGRTVNKTFPSDVFAKYRKEFEKRGRAATARYRLKAIVGGTGKIARGG